MITIISFFTDNGYPKLGLSPTINIRRVDTGSLVIEGVSMSELGDGWYKYEFDGDEDLEYAIRCDGGTDLTNAERYTFAGSEIKSHIVEPNERLKRILGLVHENYRIIDPIYDNHNNMISGVIKTYPSAEDVENDTNPIAEYLVTAEFDPKRRLTGYKTKKI